MIKTISENWLEELNNELVDTNTVCIVSPFITDGVVRHLLGNFKGNKIKVITRYNLNEFRRGVSSISAMERLLKNNTQIKGIKGLHSKLYLFDSKSVIITSANFTNGGFFNNKEFGILSRESKTIEESYNYFNDLWRIDSNILDLSTVVKWKEEINILKSQTTPKEELPDYGSSYQDSIIGKRRYFVKFFGKADNRLMLNNRVKADMYNGCSHFALSFARNKNNARPRRYRDGDIVFMARMTKEPDDYAIFGRATTYAHNDKRDEANDEDIKHINWLKEWPILVRVKEPKFIDSTFLNCPKLYDLIKELDYDSFASTKRKFDNGGRDIKTKNSLMRKGDVILSDSGAQWMELAFEKAIKSEGKVNDVFVKDLYQSLTLK